MILSKVLALCAFVFSFDNCRCRGICFMEYKFKWTNIWFILSPVQVIALKIMTCLNVIRLNRPWIHELGLGKSLRGKKKKGLPAYWCLKSQNWREGVSFFLFHYGLLQKIEYSFLCYTVGPCYLSILNIIVCICIPQTLSLSLSLSNPWKA